MELPTYSQHDTGIESGNGVVSNDKAQYPATPEAQQQQQYQHPEHYQQPQEPQQAYQQPQQQQQYHQPQPQQQQQQYQQPQQQQQQYHQPQQQQQQYQQPQQQQQFQQQPLNQQRPGNTYQTATPLASLQEYPAPVDCPRCGVREMTITTAESGGYTTAWAAIACFFCCLGCIPFMISSFKDVLHKCGHCGAPVALWHRSGRTEVLAHR